MIQLPKEHGLLKIYSILEYQLSSVASSVNAHQAASYDSGGEEFDWHGKTILIAEDEEFNFLYLREILASTKATIIRAMDGEMAVNICQNKSVDVVLMDIKMPKMNGLEATKSIRSFNLHIPVIAQTAYAFVEDSEKCLNAGCSGYLTKPINKKVLLGLLDTYLR
jgi:CheY-like chemotaxis protein